MVRNILLLILTATLTGCADAPPSPEEMLRPVRSQTVRAAGGGRARTCSGLARAG